MQMIWKNVSAYRSSGIFNKMILIISFLLLLSFLFSLTVLQYVYRIYDKQIYEKASEVLGMSSISIENALRELDQLSLQWCLMSKFKNACANCRMIHSLMKDKFYITRS